MCMLCVEIINERIMVREAVRARKELHTTVDHADDINELIEEKYGREAWIEAKIMELYGQAVSR